MYDFASATAWENASLRMAGSRRGGTIFRFVGAGRVLRGLVDLTFAFFMPFDESISADL